MVPWSFLLTFSSLLLANTGQKMLCRPCAIPSQWQESACPEDIFPPCLNNEGFKMCKEITNLFFVHYHPLGRGGESVLASQESTLD